MVHRHHRRGARGLRRRTVLAAGAALAATAIRGRAPLAGTTLVSLERRSLRVGGREVDALAILADGREGGLVLPPGARFRARLVNRLDEPSLIHWHGQTPPSDQDGVPDLSQPALGPGGAYDYDFAPRPGTHWMHSHVGLQEQRLLAAPMIVQAPGEDARDERQVVVLLHDLTFRDPDEVLAELRSGGGAHAAHAGHGMASLNDVEHDAFLANGRTLDDPEVVAVERRGRVRLRLINGAAATNFRIDLGPLAGTLVAVDGNDVAPVPANRVPLAIAQRADILIDLPAESGPWPILALREGGPQRTGIVLAAPGATVDRIAVEGESVEPALDASWEPRLAAAAPIAERPTDRTLALELGGGGPDYFWTQNGSAHAMDAPLDVREGERVEIAIRNATRMAHPMHLHGHHFQVVGLDGTRFRGALRDTVLVPVDSEVTLAFDADNPGRWALHCHNLYHMLSGMMTEVRYVA